MQALLFYQQIILFLCSRPDSRNIPVAFIIVIQKIIRCDVEQLADLSDKLIRGEIATPNEMRQAAGMKPSKDPKSDELRNRNLNEAVPKEESTADSGTKTNALESLASGP